MGQRLQSRYPELCLSLWPAADAVLAVVKPSPPAGFLKRAETPSTSAAEDSDALIFELPADASPLQRRVAAILQHKLHLPELLLIILFAVRPWVWAAALAWILCAAVADRMEVGPLYVLGTICALVFLNLGKRRAGEASAYSVFNQFRALPGQLTADELDHQVRHGQM